MASADAGGWTGGAPSALEPARPSSAQRGPPTSRQAGPSGAQPCAAREGGRRAGGREGSICCPSPPPAVLRHGAPPRLSRLGPPRSLRGLPGWQCAGAPWPGRSRGPDVVRGSAPRPSGEVPRVASMRDCAPASSASLQEPGQLAWGVRGSADARGAAASRTPEQRPGAWARPCAVPWRDGSRRL